MWRSVFQHEFPDRSIDNYQSIDGAISSASETIARSSGRSTLDVDGEIRLEADAAASLLDLLHNAGRYLAHSRQIHVARRPASMTHR